jgi:hypothetical protein
MSLLEAGRPPTGCVKANTVKVKTILMAKSYIQFNHETTSFETVVSWDLTQKV